MGGESTEKASYKQVIKATSIFGGVQVINIIVQVIRSKVIAVLLGPVGIGITGLFTANLNLISTITSFGLGTIAVKDCSDAYASENIDNIKSTISLFKKLVWLTGGLGVIVTIAFSPLLSIISFENNSYTFDIILLSITLLFTQLTTSYLVILQSSRNLKLLAKANVVSSIASLFITLPLYYFLGIKGIVPALILMGLATLLISKYFSNKVYSQENINMPLDIIWLKGKDMLKMGLIITSGILFGQITSYIFRIFINDFGGLEDVGLYTAGFSIINTYVGMVFAAMTTDYYPRLSSISSDNEKSIQSVNHQAEIAILILAPILVFFIVFVKPIVLILYSSQFITIIGMLYCAALGIFFKATSWTISFLFLAKNDRKLFFWNELITDIYLLLFNIIGYYYYGLTGIGMAMLATNIVYVIQVICVSRWRYKFYFYSSYWSMFGCHFTIAILSLLTTLFISSLSSYIIGMTLFLVSLSYSFKHLDNKIGVLDIIKTRIKSI